MFRKQDMNLVVPTLLSVLLLCCRVGKIRCATVSENSTDMLSLLDFRMAVSNDPSGVFNSWNASTPFCRWKGVACSSTHPGRVTTLNLSGQGLSGLISPSLGNLTFLHTLDLSTNHFFGQLPPINRLHKLQVLDLSTNSLHGTIPDAITNCSNLRTLFLKKNLLDGEIPFRLYLLSNLSDLVLSGNNISGVIPPSLGNLSSLGRVGLADNNLTGSIPDELGKLSNLSALILGGNRLSGEIPQAILNISSLQRLALENNALGGTIPSNIGDALRKLRNIFLSINLFEGQIPASLGNASSLDYIDLTTNSLTGQVPSSLGKLSNLTVLNVEHNKLEAMDNQSWEFLSTLSNCSSLKVLSLQGNQLQGVIPGTIGNLSRGLQQLFFGKNILSGVVPRSIGNLGGLIKLDLSFNSFNGTIEEWIGKLTNLQSLLLQRNNFTGAFPSSITNLTYLEGLVLASNGFEGLIPPNLGNLEHLDSLNLSQNNFHGNIPSEFDKLSQLLQLDLSSNKLTGEIPEVFSQSQNLAIMKMDQNFLTGDIPASFSKIKSLTVLTLSHNNLSGNIPVTLGDLPLLTKLDLSYNNFQGEVPGNGVFQNSMAVSLDGNPRLCGGAPNLHMPSCRAVSERTNRRNDLIKILIPIFGFMSLILLVYFLLLVKKTSRTHEPLSDIGENFPKVSYKDLAQATRSFSESNIIGRGSYGTVYRGKLKESKEDVAVKVFDLEMRGAERSFLSECEALRSIQHRNLLRIITACSTVDNEGNVFKALIYEFMPNGSLDRWLHDKGNTKSPKCLSLTQRINIAANIADALDYLHNDCGRPTVHCDLKPSNILLDDDMTALLGDFGIARFYVDSWSAATGSISSIGLKGTIGYIAPEYAGGGHASISGDVYSFGIVLLEMMTGKRPTDPIFKEGLDIVNFVEGNLPDQILHILDAHLVEECNKDFNPTTVSENPAYQCMVSLLQVALSCARPSTSDRMQMKQTASKLHAIKASYLGVKAKMHT